MQAANLLALSHGFDRISAKSYAELFMNKELHNLEEN